MKMYAPAVLLALLAAPAAAPAAVRSSPSSAPRTPSPAAIRAAEDFSQVAQLANPWVVNINTTRYVRQRVAGFWEDFYGLEPVEPGRASKQQSLGSGFIYSADGLILTNAHVVEGADEVRVRLVDGSEYSAQVLGSDPNVDLALLRIAAPAALPAANLGDSSRVRVGEWAIAIGNPFGFDHSLTVGVISAKERTNIFSGQGAARYQNYLQTDASINRGNSGGPLCNIRGEVIGMNTAISTPNEGSIGIGFAIPINFIKRSVPDLLRSGKVQAPRLGFFTQDLDEPLAKSLKLPSDKGVLVTDVAAGGAAAKAGLKRGDVLLALGGKPVANSAELRTRIYEAEPGSSLKLETWRDGARRELLVTPQALKAAAARGATWHGLKVRAQEPEEAEGRGLDPGLGVVVSSVSEASGAARTGIKPGDLLLELNQRRIKGLKGWEQLTRSADEGEEAVLLLVRGRRSGYVVVPAEQ